MKFDIKFDLNAEALAWIWMEWMTANCDGLCKPDSMEQLRSIAETHVENGGLDSLYGIQPGLVDATQRMLGDQSDTFLGEVTDHIRRFPEWKEE